MVQFLHSMLSYQNTSFQRRVTELTVQIRCRLKLDSLFQKQKKPRHVSEKCLYSIVMDFKITGILCIFFNIKY